MFESTEPSSLLDPACRDARDRRRLDAWLQLQATLGLAPQRAIACLVEAPDPVRALARSRETPVLDPPALERARRALVRSRTRALPWGSPQYPEPLRALSDAPPLLLVSGDAAALQMPAVAIVGARAATVTGLEVARHAARLLASAGVVIVSGLARGIDAAAHRGALEAGGRTIAIQACGPDRIYPAEHRGLAAQIRQRGAILTELPVGAPPRKPHFPLRNRLISGLSKGVIVVEARERSGSLITARHAADQGRDVMALPGPITAPTSWGPNRLIRDGATPLLEPADVLAWAGVEATAIVETGGGDPEPRSPAVLDEEQRRIVDLLSRGPLSRDELIRHAGREPGSVSLLVLDLELAGLVEESRDGRIHLKVAAATVLQ